MHGNLFPGMKRVQGRLGVVSIVVILGGPSYRAEGVAERRRERTNRVSRSLLNLDEIDVLLTRSYKLEIQIFIHSDSSHRQGQATFPYLSSARVGELSLPCCSC